MRGSGPKPSASAATSAAPVGVTSSSSISTPWIGAPRSSSSVAGAGSGSVPWAASTKPRPIGSGEHSTCSTFSDSSASATPTTSPIASIAPTSWKCTRSGSMPWILPSAMARRLNASWARCFARVGEVGRVDQRADRRPVTVRLLGRAGDGRGRRGDPVALGLAGLDLQVDGAQVDLRARVDQRAEEHVARDAADAVDVEDHSDCLAIRAAIVPAPNPSSMLTTATPAAQETSIAFSAVVAAVGGAVAGARGHADHRRRDEAADDRARARHPSPRRRSRSARVADPPARAPADGCRPRPRRGGRSPRCRATRRGSAPLAPPARRTCRRRRSSPGRAPRARCAPPRRAARARPPGASGATSRSAARAASSARVTITLPAPASSNAAAIAPISAGVLPSAMIPSGAP